jgi:hypothetical protein
MIKDTIENSDDDRIIVNEEIYITEYAPDAFAYLRKIDNIDSHVIRQSLSTEKNR